MMKKEYKVIYCASNWNARSLWSAYRSRKIRQNCREFPRTKLSSQGVFCDVRKQNDKQKKNWLPIDLPGDYSDVFGIQSFDAIHNRNRPSLQPSRRKKMYIHLTDGWIASCSDNTIRLIYDDRRKMLKHNLHFVGWLLDDANVVLPVETAVWPLSLLMTYTILQFDKLNNIDGGIYMPNSHLSIELFIYVLFIYSFRHQIGASAMNTHDE